MLQTNDQLNTLANAIVDEVSRPNLNNMREFYLLYPICQTSDKLTWSHICELITIDDELERSFYEKECIVEYATYRSEKAYQI